MFLGGYYFSGLLLENLKRKLKIRHGQDCIILVRFDHIFVESEGEIIVYLLVRHNSGKCIDFLHQGIVDCTFYFYQWPRVTGEFYNPHPVLTW